VVHPNNPTGHYTRPEETAALNAICAAHGMAIIADEVFLDFALAGARPPRFVSNHAALTFTTSGVSKISGLPQMKFAWLAVNGPPDLKREALARLELLADTYLSMNAPTQLAAPVLLRQRASFQQQLMRRVRVPATRSDEELALELLEKHDVYAHPGHFYDFPGEGYLVLSLIAPEEDFAEGMRRIVSVVNTRE
jgi:alanine-synthesizing transaminase